ncbi:MAG: universal stress protein [Bacteroidota bacterium]
MKILVPVDLYESTYASYKYARNFAGLINAKITLLYVINSVFTANEVVSYDPYLEMETTAKRRLEEFSKKFQQDFGNDLPDVDVDLKVMFGIPGLAIPEYAETNKFDLIVIGVRDKHGFLDRLLGSVSNETINEAKCPTILIHQRTEYKVPEKILFAFDKKTDLDDALENYKELNDIIKAKTDFLHINVKQTDDISEQKAEIVSELFENDDPKFAFEIKTLSGTNVNTGIRDYCHFEHIDLITMIHRKEGLFTNFLRPDKSIKLAQDFHLPVIVFQED